MYLISEVIQLGAGGAHSADLSAVADSSPTGFQSVYNNYCPVEISLPFSRSSKLLSLALPSNMDASKAIKRIRPYTSVGPHDISVFVITGCSLVFILLLRLAYLMWSLSQHIADMRAVSNCSNIHVSGKSMSVVILPLHSPAVLRAQLSSLIEIICSPPF